ncbi:MAG: hypothetical protein VKJ46_14810 [Leptolyngbyaceae bacterium]|nr:hypothetical protein [Leptolyngbyaceae bacterium]
MVYASKQRTDNKTAQTDIPVLLDPSLLRAARQIYRTYYESQTESFPRPLGVAIDRNSHRGKLIFARKPILLPQEHFIPFNQLEAELH